MKKLTMITLAFVLVTPIAFAADQTSRISCPPGYAMHIDPVPPPTDDPLQATTTYQPKTALEKQQEQQQANAAEMARLHCIPLSEVTHQ